MRSFRYNSHVLNEQERAGRTGLEQSFQLAVVHPMTSTSFRIIRCHSPSCCRADAVHAQAELAGDGGGY